MNTAGLLLFSLYFMELIMQVFTMAYVIVLWMRPRSQRNPYLHGARLRVATLLPLIWFIYVYTDAYEVWQVCKSYGWDINENSLLSKAAREGLSLCGAIITFLLISGYEFEE